MNRELYNMLKTSAESDIAKAKLTLSLMSDNAVGIGDHSTSDFYNNAEEALSLLADANDRLQTLVIYNERDNS
jgi:hypothetical protein